MQTIEATKPHKGEYIIIIFNINNNKGENRRAAARDSSRDNSPQ